MPALVPMLTMDWGCNYTGRQHCHGKYHKECGNPECGLPFHFRLLNKTDLPGPIICLYFSRPLGLSGLTALIFEFYMSLDVLIIKWHEKYLNIY